MADYRSILDRAISGLSDNTENARRAIYDKARNALMRQLSSLEPALSPAEISKQRLQLEEAVRDTENRFNGIGDLENAVADAVSNAQSDAPVVEPPKIELTPEPAPEPEPAPTPEPEPAPEPAPTPAPEPEPEPEPKLEPAPELEKEVSAPEVKISDQQEPDSPEIKNVEVPEIEPKAPDIADDTADTELELKGLDIVAEAEATLARVDSLKSETLNPLDELKQTMAEDNSPAPEAPSVSVTPPDTITPADDIETPSPAQPPEAPEIPESFETGETPTVNIDTSDEAALIAAASKKPMGKGKIGIVALLIFFGIGAFGWAQRDVLAPTISPLYTKLQQSVSNFFGSSTQPEKSATPPSTAKEAELDGPTKAEDRILNTPLETTPKEPEAAPEIQPGKRITLPSDAQTAPRVVPPISTPDKNADAAQAVPETITPTTTPVTNIFTASAILYEERKDSGRPDVSTGNVTWEFLEKGSEAIGSTGLPSVRGNSRVQNRDVSVRFEIMRNLDDTLPASHLIEIEFEAGELFAKDAINNVAGVLMKENEQDNGQPLVGAVVKVSDTVFWIAMSARAADLASNTDALKKKKWFDIPIIFASGKRAILTLEKGAAGTKAIEQAFIAWAK